MFFRLFKRHKQPPAKPAETPRDRFVAQLNVDRFVVPAGACEKLPGKTRDLVQHLIRTKQLAPIYPAVDVYCDDDKECMICCQTVRQGMNMLMCCGGKRFICTACLLQHPKANLANRTVYCDFCQKDGDLKPAPVDVDAEWHKMENQPPEDTTPLDEFIRTHQPHVDDPLDAVRKDVKAVFQSYGIALRTDVPAEQYNGLDLSIITDAGMARAVMESL